MNFYATQDACIACAKQQLMLTNLLLYIIVT